LIKRPDDLEIYPINLQMNRRRFDSIELNLAHINKEKRSNFLPEEVTLLFIQLVDGLSFDSVDEKKFGNDFCKYYVEIGKFGNKKFKVVFCICSDRPKSIGIITFYRM